MSPPLPATWVVGHDGSDGGAHAAAWALSHAVDRDVEIALVRAWQIPAVEIPLPVDMIDDFAPTQVCDDFDEICATAQMVGVSVSGQLVRGEASAVLLAASEDTELLVVGARGLGGFRRLVLGSVSSQCATHARVPTVVVPASAPTDRPMRRIVVGIDGSARSLQALRWAVDFAPASCRIEVVGAWRASRSGYVEVAQIVGHEFDHERTGFGRVLDGVEADIGATIFERSFVNGDPAQVLLKASDDADLLVVGQRGRSGWGAALLGSVTTRVLHHPGRCPVVVVPEAD